MRWWVRGQVSVRIVRGGRVCLLGLPRGTARTHHRDPGQQWPQQVPTQRDTESPHTTIKHFRTVPRPCIMTPDTRNPRANRTGVHSYTHHTGKGDTTWHGPPTTPTTYPLQPATASSTATTTPAVNAGQTTPSKLTISTTPAMTPTTVTRTSKCSAKTATRPKHKLRPKPHGNNATAHSNAPHAQASDSHKEQHGAPLPTRTPNVNERHYQQGGWGAPPFPTPPAGAEGIGPQKLYGYEALTCGFRKKCLRRY